MKKPSNAEGHYEQAVKLYNEADYNKAIEAVAKSLELHYVFTCEAYFLLGACKKAIGDVSWELDIVKSNEINPYIMPNQTWEWKILESIENTSLLSMIETLENELNSIEKKFKTDHQHSLITTLQLKLGLFKSYLNSHKMAQQNYSTDTRIYSGVEEMAIQKRNSREISDLEEDIKKAKKMKANL